MAEFLANRPAVVGIDGTEFSLRALDWAADHAAAFHCPLRLVHVTTGRGPAPASVQAQVYRRLAFRPGAAPPATVWRVRHGSRIEVLLDEAAGARILVIGHREPQPLFGSTLRGILVRGAGTTVVVPGGWRSGRPVGRIVAGVDLRDPDRVLDTAFRTAEQWHCPLRVIHAIDLPTVRRGTSLLDRTRRLEDTALAELERVLAEPRRKYREVAVEPAVIEGDPADVLVHAARLADLLIIGGRPRRGLPTMIGTTTEAIMKETDRPVVLARPYPSERRTDDAA